MLHRACTRQIERDIVELDEQFNILPPAPEPECEACGRKTTELIADEDCLVCHSCYMLRPIG